MADSTILYLTPDQFRPGDVVLYFSELYVQALPEPRPGALTSYSAWAVAVEGVDGPSSIQYFDADCRYKVRRPPVAPVGISMADARKSEREWLAHTLAFTAART